MSSIKQVPWTPSVSDNISSVGGVWMDPIRSQSSDQLTLTPHMTFHVYVFDNETYIVSSQPRLLSTINPFGSFRKIAHDPMEICAIISEEVLKLNEEKK